MLRLQLCWRKNARAHSGKHTEHPDIELTFVYGTVELGILFAGSTGSAGKQYSLLLFVARVESYPYNFIVYDAQPTKLHICSILIYKCMQSNPKNAHNKREHQRSNALHLHATGTKMDLDCIQDCCEAPYQRVLCL